MSFQSQKVFGKSYLFFEIIPLFSLPFFLGCREISFIYDGNTNTDTDPDGDDDARLFIDCGVAASNGEDIGAYVVVRLGKHLFLLFSFSFFFFFIFFLFLFLFLLTVSLLVNSYGNGGSWYLSACFDEPTYVHCAVGNFFESGKEPGPVSAFFLSFSFFPFFFLFFSFLFFSFLFFSFLFFSFLFFSFLYFFFLLM